MVTFLGFSTKKEGLIEFNTFSSGFIWKILVNMGNKCILQTETRDMPSGVRVSHNIGAFRLVSGSR